MEVFFDPQTHTARGIPFGVVADGMLRALKQAETERGITSKLILCFLRHLDEDDALATLKSAEPYLDRIAGVGSRLVRTRPSARRNSSMFSMRRASAA